MNKPRRVEVWKTLGRTEMIDKAMTELAGTNPSKADINALAATYQATQILYVGWFQQWLGTRPTALVELDCGRVERVDYADIRFIEED